MTYERFVVVGCGRSGTRYASELFSRMGIKCGHQRVFNRPELKFLEWKDFVGDSSAFAVPSLNLVDDNTLVIHQVRNPWRVVQSLVHAKHLPEQNPVGGKLYGKHVEGWDRYSDLHERAAFIWWQWNLLIEHATETRANCLFQRVEDYSIEKVGYILHLLGREFTWQMQKVFKQLETNVGTVKPQGHPPNLEKMPHGFWGMVSRYGYEKP